MNDKERLELIRRIFEQAVTLGSSSGSIVLSFDTISLALWAIGEIAGDESDGHLEKWEDFAANVYPPRAERIAARLRELMPKTMNDELLPGANNGD